MSSHRQPEHGEYQGHKCMTPPNRPLDCLSLLILNCFTPVTKVLVPLGLSTGIPVRFLGHTVPAPVDTVPVCGVYPHQPVGVAGFHGVYDVLRYFKSPAGYSS